MPTMKKMMKMIAKRVKIFAVVAATALATTSCLDKMPGSAIPVDEAMKSYEEADQIVTGIYGLMKSSALWSGLITLLPDIQADLVYAVDGYTNTYGQHWQWDIRSTNSEIEAVYASLYGVIAQCNFFLERVDEVIRLQTDDDRITALEQYTGEVYTIRALCYSELLKLYCEAYDPARATEQLGVVLRKGFSMEEPAVRASLYDSYEFVVKDLERAEEILDENEHHTVVETKKILNLLGDEEELCEVIGDTNEADIMVTLGDENEKVDGCALIKAPIIINGAPVASLAVIGPERMDYASIASAIKIVTSELNKNKGS